MRVVQRPKKMLNSYMQLLGQDNDCDFELKKKKEKVVGLFFFPNFLFFVNDNRLNLCRLHNGNTRLAAC